MTYIGNVNDLPTKKVQWLGESLVTPIKCISSPQTKRIKNTQDSHDGSMGRTVYFPTLGG